MSINQASIIKSSKLNSITKFQPKGEDVYCTKILLTIQILDFLFKVIYFTKFGLFVFLLQALFSVPLLTISIILFYRFKTAFSINNMKDIVKVSALMQVENGMNLILRFFVGVKAFLSMDESKGLAVLNLALPIIFATFWTYISHIAEQKNGHYGAPLSLMKKLDSKDSNENFGAVDLESSFIQKRD